MGHADPYGSGPKNPNGSLPGLCMKAVKCWISPSAIIFASAYSTTKVKKPDRILTNTIWSSREVKKKKKSKVLIKVFNYPSAGQQIKVNSIS